MTVFGWVSTCPEPPSTRDLREFGWTLCGESHDAESACEHLLVCGVRDFDQESRTKLVSETRHAWRLILTGVEDPADRAELLSLGCSDVLPGAVGLHELDARARRASRLFAMLPRERRVGGLTLDLFHRDASREGRWLALHPREFSLLWRLADQPGKRVTRHDLLRDVWRLDHVPETNSVEVHVARLRSKLAERGEGGLIETCPGGGYRIATRCSGEAEGAFGRHGFTRFEQLA